jgi:hypothetical protein
LFVGLERERRGKEAGLRTFGFATLLGGLGGLLGESYALLGLGVRAGAARHPDRVPQLGDAARRRGVGADHLGRPIGDRPHRRDRRPGPHVYACHRGDCDRRATAWKERLAGFSLGLTETELRSAILLAIPAFIVYPVLPEAPLDAWGLAEPPGAWLTVILIAAIGFVNYILLTLYGGRGVELAGFLGGLVNSTVTVTELAARARETGGRLADVIYRGVLLSTAAMAVRNAVLLAFEKDEPTRARPLLR